MYMQRFHSRHIIDSVGSVCRQRVLTSKDRVGARIDDHNMAGVDANEIRNGYSKITITRSFKLTKDEHI